MVSQHVRTENHDGLLQLLRSTQGFPCGSAGKESASNVGDLSLIPGLGRSLAEGKGYPLRYSGLENSMDFIVHGVAKSWTRLSDFHFTSRYTQTVFHPITKLFSAILLRKCANLFIPIFPRVFKLKVNILHYLS